MKLVYKKKKHRQWNKSHADDQEYRRLIHKEWRKKININRSRGKVIKHEEKINPDNYYVVKAPKIFSFVNNTSEVIVFITKLKNKFDEATNVYVELRGVKEIDYGAIVVLLSIMVRFKGRGIQFNGSMPKNHEARKLLNKSGFLDYLFKNFEETDNYILDKKKTDGIHTHGGKKVDANLGSNLINDASFIIWGENKRCQGVQRVLLELMQNTNNHADIDKKGEKLWWLSVRHKKADKKVFFSFVDFGVGVFESLNKKTSDSKFYNAPLLLRNIFNFQDNSELFKLILEGDLHKTVTGKPYRGKGLPGIAESMNRNQISNLHIITNNVWCDVSTNSYKLLPDSFSGTFISWELNESNEHCAA